jgi:SAM-dependent methyltransferase
VELERSRGSYERVVSVGASGRWYFDWFERSVGPVVEHIGVEAFEPEPPDLPDYVTWVPTTADHFEGLDDDSVDLVFAGQTTEHLWAEELAGFLLQAHRVLRQGGVLVIDSPNRLVTEHLRWSHGGHSVELSPAEIAELLGLAGFEVESTRGVWKCRFGGEVLGLEDRLDDGGSLVRRIAGAPDTPDDCFVWWLVARPAGEADAGAVLARAEALYAQHWAVRVCRGMWSDADGPAIEAGGSRRLVSLPFMLRAGRYRIGFRTVEGRPADVTAASLELALPGDQVVHRCQLADATVSNDGVMWEIDQPELMFALTLTVRIDGVSGPVRLAMPLTIEPLA